MQPLRARNQASNQLQLRTVIMGQRILDFIQFPLVRHDESQQSSHLP
jgi:hypothetical protein